MAARFVCCSSGRPLYLYCSWPHAMAAACTPRPLPAPPCDRESDAAVDRAHAAPPSRLRRRPPWAVHAAPRGGSAAAADSPRRAPRRRRGGGRGQSSRRCSEEAPPAAAARGPRRGGLRGGRWRPRRMAAAAQASEPHEMCQLMLEMWP
ncbi:hypothetical protein PVAP13_8KG046651 [Panicum virgatum]|uniref:Uncharacterized protein n=1 Tax=Panicum virgatum TaxID=38727 RepID=A0A8T0PPU1_PANVG|nr:hypothetical protein PVAP13_8KG046651 [Panicum virgatum]